MKNTKFNARDWRLFIIVALVLNSPPLLVRIPLVGLLAFMPSLFWVNIPGLPLALAGLPFYEIKEFGAVPKGTTGWVLIPVFWLVVAFFLTLALKKLRERKQESANGT